MKTKILAVVPFITVPLLIPIYCFLDSLIFVNIFGCGCVPSTQTNMLNIPFNANDLRLIVFSVLTVGMAVLSVILSRAFHKKIAKILYCFAAILLNVALTMWVMKAFVWA